MSPTYVISALDALLAVSLQRKAHIFTFDGDGQLRCLLCGVTWSEAVADSPCGDQPLPDLIEQRCSHGTVDDVLGETDGWRQVCRACHADLGPTKDVDPWDAGVCA